MKLSLKYMVPRILVMAATVALSAVVYKQVYWVPEVKDQGPMLYNLLEYQWHNDVLYIGESSNIWTAPEDTDRRNISDMINDSLEGFRMSGLQTPAYHAGMFLPVISWIQDNARVQHLVVTMNLRSFDKPWIYSGQEGKLMRARCFYTDRHPLLNRLSAVMGYYHNPDEKEQEQNMLNAFEFDTLKPPFALPFNTIKTWCEQEKFPLPQGGEDFPKRELADHYIKAYAFQIDTASNPRIKDFDQIAALCRQKNIRLYYNILAENTEWADSLVGPELVQLMRSNRDLLIRRYAAMGVVMIDNLELVGGVHFGEKKWTTEHYDQTGRMLIARNVRDTLQKYMRKN